MLAPPLPASTTPPARVCSASRWAAGVSLLSRCSSHFNGIGHLGRRVRLRPRLDKAIGAQGGVESSEVGSIPGLVDDHLASHNHSEIACPTRDHRGLHAVVFAQRGCESLGVCLIVSGGAVLDGNMHWRSHHIRQLQCRTRRHRANESGRGQNRGVNLGWRSHRGAAECSGCILVTDGWRRRRSRCAQCGQSRLAWLRDCSCGR